LIKIKGINSLKIRNKISLFLLLAAVLIILPFTIENQYFVHILIMVFFYAFCASAWNIISGFAGQLSFGHAAFLAIGAYSSGLLFNYLNLSPWVGMLVGGVIAAGVAVLIGIPAFRLRGAYYAISTIAFSEGFRIILETVKKVGNWDFGAAEGIMIKPIGGDSFAAIQFTSKIPYYFIILVMLILVILIAMWIERSKLGYYLSAVKEDQEAALALGIDAHKMKLIAAGISAFLTALGGAFYIQLIRYIEPASIAGSPMSDQLVFFCVVGGIGTVGGPVFGAILLTIIGELARVYFSSLPGLHLVIYGVIVVIVILFSPHGMLEPVRKRTMLIIRKLFVRSER
jgi:branched-chain amino acid transport system permease protein